MTINLKENERLDDLQRNGYQIIQNPEKFCFGMDAVLLSGFAHAREEDVLLDMGTGTGIIPILMAAKTDIQKIIGLEIQEESADMAILITKSAFARAWSVCCLAMRFQQRHGHSHPFALCGRF